MEQVRQASSCFTRNGLHKRGWPSRQMAVRAARRAQCDQGRMNVYRGACGSYHLGHDWFSRP